MVLVGDSPWLHCLTLPPYVLIENFPSCDRKGSLGSYAFLLGYFAWYSLWQILISLCLSSALIICNADRRENVNELQDKIRHFEEEWNIPVLKIANIDGPLLPDGKSFDGRVGIKVVRIIDFILILFLSLIQFAIVIKMNILGSNCY